MGHRSASPRQRAIAPSLRRERALLSAGAQCVAGIDEVGRGALAGPVTIGVVVVDRTTPTAPRGIRDSKELSRAARERLAPLVRRWAVDVALGEASAAEIDEIGIMAAMQRAALRALSALDRMPGAILLDGSHDFLSPVLGTSVPEFGVMAHVGGDRTCSTVAAASIVAKVARDDTMRDLSGHHPDYGWDRNVGYGSEEHRRALRDCGLSPEHRRSFSLASIHPQGD